MRTTKVRPVRAVAIKMKLVTIDCREIGGRPGVMLAGGEILDLAAAPSTLNQAQWIPYSVVSVLAAGRDGFERVASLIDAVDAKDDRDRDELRRDGVLLPATGTTLLPPVRRPGLVLVVQSDGAAYVKSPNTAVGDGATVSPPWNDDAPLGCTGMLAAVFGRPLYRAGREEAAEAVVGYTLLLDLAGASVGDRQRRIESSQFPGAGPMGPAIVTIDELGEPREHALTLSLNDVAVASESAYGHSQDVPDRLALLSQRYGFRPGDIVCFEPPPEASMHACRLRAGDRVRLSLDEVLALEIGIAPS